MPTQFDSSLREFRGRRVQPSALDPNVALQRKLNAGENFGTAFLKDSIAKGRVFESQAEDISATHDVNVGAIGGRLRRVQAGANLAAQRAGSSRFSGPRGFSRQLDQAVKRGKARQGINQRGDKAIRNQQLKDRIALARRSISKRGQIMQSSENAARLRAGGEAATQRANDQTRSAFVGAAGAIAGGAVRGFGDKFFDTGDLSSGMADQQADVDRFLGAGPGDVGGLDNIFDGGGFDFTLPQEGFV